MQIRTLIVDDEPHARSRIRSLLACDPGVEVVGECEDGEEAIAAIVSLRPDLLFLDVQLRGCTAFDVIGAVGGDLPVTVFVTAYGEHAIQAFDVEAADYLLKPFDAARFRRAFERGRARLAAQRGSRAAAPEAGRGAGPLEWFMVRGAARELRLLRAEDVDWIEACGNYVFLHVGEARHLYRRTMAALEAQLDRERFVRIHRSTIVNLFAIRSLEPIYAGDCEVRLKGGRVLRMSRSYRDALERLTGRAG